MGPTWGRNEICDGSWMEAGIIAGVSVIVKRTHIRKDILNDVRAKCPLHITQSSRSCEVCFPSSWIYRLCWYGRRIIVFFIKQKSTFKYATSFSVFTTSMLEEGGFQMNSNILTIISIQIHTVLQYVQKCTLFQVYIQITFDVLACHSIQKSKYASLLLI